MNYGYPQFQIELRCHLCKDTLDDATMSCVRCGFVVRKLEGVPVFMDQGYLHQTRLDEKSDAENAFKKFFKRWPRMYRFLLHVCVPVLFNGVTAQQFIKKLSPIPGRILNIGSGPRILHPNALNVDIFPYSNVNILARAEALPFEDGIFDLVCSEQVLEHVERPWEVARELVRVTKKSGLIYTSTPLIFPLHPSPKDYSRWSIEGLVGLFEGCAKDRSGILNGPVSGMLIVLASGLATIFSFGFTPLRKVNNYIFMALLTPLKLLDFIYSKLPGAEDTAASVWVTVKKI